MHVGPGHVTLCHKGENDWCSLQVCLPSMVRGVWPGFLSRFTTFNFPSNDLQSYEPLKMTWLPHCVHDVCVVFVNVAADERKQRKWDRRRAKPSFVLRKAKPGEPEHKVHTEQPSPLLSIISVLCFCTWALFFLPVTSQQIVSWAVDTIQMRTHISAVWKQVVVQADKSATLWLIIFQELVLKLLPLNPPLASGDKSWGFTSSLPG